MVVVAVRRTWVVDKQRVQGNSNFSRTLVVVQLAPKGLDSDTERPAWKKGYLIELQGYYPSSTAVQAEPRELIFENSYLRFPASEECLTRVGERKAYYRA